ncbi:N-acetylmuramoyl-L-alanine amidase [Aeoliella mucimassa]|uniref:N-acetylmuramoyl-L-alanine amidase n=1 Tax=Aeoliella mucimassa TaxID=2527972 RepID=A0A518ASX7_9BACT|nr:N-acetylmuramoyl-L-alanine amidase [Aeoliella mucimassa]QDU57797.1 N-acetyl-anhydromuranmyl-L-alanine amidase [Aeoliella mucimassa]
MSFLRALLSSSFACFVLATTTLHAQQVGEQIERQGDEIVVCGQLFHTTAPVKLWMDPGGYDAYRIERRFVPFEKSDWDTTLAEAKLDSPNRYGIRKEPLTPDELEQVRGGGWDLPLLQKVVDQFVMHYDVCGRSETCFNVLHDHRGLSVHFMVDVDGTIYQTLDLKERAWHATISNTRSIGVEIAHIGAYRSADAEPLKKWYQVGDDGIAQLKLLEHTSDPSLNNPLARPKIVEGTIQGTKLYQYDFTEAQYDSLIKLTATLSRVFPKIKLNYPRDEEGQLIPRVLPKEDWQDFQGVLGHYHIQKNKTDPGPAFDWEKVIGGAKELVKE